MLVVSPNWLGDAVMSLPALQGLRSLFPQARITVAARAAVAGLYRGVPCVDECLAFRKPAGQGRITWVVPVAARIRRLQCTLALVFPRSVSTALLCVLGRVHRRVGFSAGLRDALLTDPVARTRKVLANHQVHYYPHLLAPLGQAVIPAHPEVVVPPEAQQWAAGFLSRHGLQPERPLLALSPGAAYGPAKQWPAARFVTLARGLHTRTGCGTIVFGDAGARPVTAAVREQIGEGAVDAGGRTDIMQLAALLQRCCVLVTNDSGAMHLAAAAGTPVVALFGSTDPQRTGPLGPQATVVRRDVGCNPCFRRTCPHGHYRCLDAIDVETVATAALAHLASGSRPDSVEDLQ